MVCLEAYVISRMCAGQAVVQMAKSTRDGLEYAIKFFVSQAAFHAESELHSCATSDFNPLVKFLPKV